jgi:hypothetical protein
VSERFDGRLLSKISKLQLPDPEGVVLNSSGALAERRVIPMDSVGDIDATISEENILSLQERVGWYLGKKVVGASRHTGRPLEITVIYDENKEFDFHRHGFSVFDYNRTGQGRHSLQTQIEFSDQDPATGIYVASIDYVVGTKLETNRVKDADRIELVEIWRRQQGQ